jgi:hypothetical protein
MQEAYELSVKALINELGGQHMNITIVKERDQSVNRKVEAEKKALKANKKLMARTAEVNNHDIKLYELGM